MRTPLIASAAIVVFGLGLARAESDSPIIYVNSQAVGVNDGSSWADAFIDLQDALQLARTMPVEPVQIWIAGGSYKPDRGTGDRSATFALCDSLQMYGGFAGWESCLDERIRGAYPTVLDGDLLGDDDPDAEPTSNCCVRRGQPGCDNEECSEFVGQLRPRCVNHDWEMECVDLATFHFPDLCRPTRADNTHALLQVFDLNGTIVLDGLTIRGGDGNCLGVECPSDVGGLYARNSDLYCTHCEFVENSGFGTGAVAVYGPNNKVEFDTCTIRSNGDIVRKPVVMSTSIVESMTIDNCLFVENRWVVLSLGGDDPKVRRCRFLNNRASSVFLSGRQITLWDCVFADNSPPIWSVFQTGFYPSQLINCSFLGNHCEQCLCALNAPDPIILLNCAFIGNTAGANPFMGAAIAGIGPALMLNNLSYGNSVISVTDGTISVGAGAHVANSSFYGNSVNGVFNQKAQLSIAEPESVTLRYNNIMGWTGSLGGVGNVDFEPQFVDPDGPDDVIGTPDDNLRLSPGSPLINLGDPDPDLYPYLDADGHNRILRGRIDMGAYEYGIGDIDEDDVFTLTDLRYFWACMYGPDSPANLGECIAFDFHAQPDDRIDLLDFAGVQIAFAGGE